MRHEDGLTERCARPMISVERGVFRANPRYELVLLDRLAPHERQLLRDLDDDDLYGVLRPQPGSGMEWRMASSDTALLFLTLAKPAVLPAYVVARLGNDVEQTIARLVLDGVFEIEHNGHYVCGADAGELVLAGQSEGGRGRIGEMSIAALRYAQELPELPVTLLAMRLYCYGRRPVCPELRRRLINEPAVATYLGIAPGGSNRAGLEAGWIEVPRTPGQGTCWRRWRVRPASRTARERSGANYKLYVSPALTELPIAVGAVAASLATASGARAFKVGCDLPGICRPDKLVVYFDRLDDLQEGATRLSESLAGCPAHGVPFSAAITHDGLLSWGADPPPNSADGTVDISWRMWVTERLAEFLTFSRSANSRALEPWQFALERLRLSGIDTNTWIPASGMWPNALAGV